MRRVFLALLLLLLFPMLALSAVRYVDKDDGACTDGGSGLTNAPYCTIQAGLDDMVAGDTMRIRPASTPYDQNAAINSSRDCTAGSRCIIESDPATCVAPYTDSATCPILRLTGSQSATGAIQIKDSDYWTVRNLTFDGAGVFTSAFALWVQAATQNVVGLQVLNNTFKNWGGTEAQGANTCGVCGVLIISHGGESIWTAAALIQGNTFTNNRLINMFLIHTVDTVVDSNDISGTTCGRDSDTAVNALGIKIISDDNVATFSNNVTVSNNHIHDFQEHSACGITSQGHGTWAGIWCDVESLNGLVTGNRVHHIDQNKGNNGNPNGLSSSATGIFIELECNDWVVKNNLVWDIGYLGIRLGSNAAGVSRRPKVYNNTIFSTAGTGLGMLNAEDADIRNNLFVDNAANAITVHPDSVALGGHTINNNVYFNTANNNLIGIWGSSGVTNYATWKTNCAAGGGTGCDAASLNVNPLLAASPASPDPLFFRLCQASATPVAGCSGTSPAIDAGATIASVTTDYASTARPQPGGGAYDIGAYEMSSGGGPPTVPTAPANLRIVSP